MLGEILSSFIDKEQAAYDAIQDTLESIAEELNCTKDDFIISIKPLDEKFNFRCYIMKIVKSKPTFVREITIKEIITGEKELKQE